MRPPGALPSRYSGLLDARCTTPDNAPIRDRGGPGEEASAANWDIELGKDVVGFRYSAAVLHSDWEPNGEKGRRARWAAR